MGVSFSMDLKTWWHRQLCRCYWTIFFFGGLNLVGPIFLFYSILLTFFIFENIRIKNIFLFFVLYVRFGSKLQIKGQ